VKKKINYLYNAASLEKSVVTHLVKKLPVVMIPKGSLHIHKSPPLDPILSKLNPVPTFTATLILFSHLCLGLTSGFFSSDFLT